VHGPHRHTRIGALCCCGSGGGCLGAARAWLMCGAGARRYRTQFFCGPDAVRSAKLSKTEKSRKAKSQKIATEKAMRTLRIKKGKASDVTAADVEDDDGAAAASASGGGGRGARAGRGRGRGGRRAARKKATPSPEGRTPTVTQVYREIMAKAGRKPVGMYERIAAARRRQNKRLRVAEEAESGSDDEASETEDAATGDKEEKEERDVAEGEQSAKEQDAGAAAAADSDLEDFELEVGDHVEVQDENNPVAW
jgi:hypothetical protein